MNNNPEDRGGQVNKQGLLERLIKPVVSFRTSNFAKAVTQNIQLLRRQEPSLGQGESELLLISDPEGLPNTVEQTDTPEERRQRVVNQQALESELNTTFGLPFEERLNLIHEKLYTGIDRVQKEGDDGYRKTPLETYGGLREVAYASPELISGKFMPALGSMIDQLSEEIKSLPETERASKALKLASVIFTLGIAIHPKVDGNGQAFRTSIISYLHELAPEEYLEKYFPYKPSNTGDNSENNLNTPFLREFMKSNAAGCVRSVHDERLEFYLNGGKIDPIPGLPTPDIPEEREVAQLDDVGRQKLREHFEDLNALAAALEMNPGRENQKSMNCTLDYLTGAVGSEAISRYVLEKEIAEIPNSRLPFYQRDAFNAFNGIGNEITNLLQTKDEHDAQFNLITSTDL